MPAPSRTWACVPTTTSAPASARPRASLRCSAVGHPGSRRPSAGTPRRHRCGHWRHGRRPAAGCFHGPRPGRDLRVRRPRSKRCSPVVRRRRRARQPRRRRRRFGMGGTPARDRVRPRSRRPDCCGPRAGCHAARQRRSRPRGCWPATPRRRQTVRAGRGLMAGCGTSSGARGPRAPSVRAIRPRSGRSPD